MIHNKIKFTIWEIHVPIHNSKLNSVTLDKINTQQEQIFQTLSAAINKINRDMFCQKVNWRDPDAGQVGKKR